MQDFHKLRAWCLAHDLSGRVTDCLPLGSSDRVTGLRGQTIRSAQSIAANLAEGCGRSTRAEFLAFVDFALGSATELENHLKAAHDARIIRQSVHYQLRGQLITLAKMIRALRQTVEHAIALEENARRNARS